jgi:hypothetical protein
MAKTKKNGAKNDWKKDAYEASASFGRIYSYFSLIGSCLFGGFFVILGLYLLFRRHTLDSVTTGTISAVKDSSYTLTFKADGKDYNIELPKQQEPTSTTTINGKTTSTHVIYNIGQSVILRYDSKNPNNISIGNPPIKGIGIGLFIFGLIIITIASIWFYFVQKNKTVAAVSGVGEATGIIGNVFSTGVGATTNAFNNEN